MHKLVKSTCGICQIGCGILVHVDGDRVTKIEGDPESPLNEGRLCAKGLASLEYLYHPDRLQRPLKRLRKRGKGIGEALLAHAEDKIRKAQGRLIVIETSSQPAYQKARRFHLSHGYQVIARIPDFYAPGNDKLILQKRLG